MPFDLANPDWKALDAVMTQMGQLDGLVNNAGLLINKPFLETMDSDWMTQFQVNVFGPAQLSRHLFPHLKKSNSAHIVNIGSMGGYQGSSKFPGLSAYSSSKAALATLTECLAEEWKGEGIHVNCLALGAVGTEMLQEAFPGYEPPLGAKAMAAYIGDFVLHQQTFYNGKILPVSISTP